MADLPHHPVRRTPRRPALRGRLDSYPWTAAERSASVTGLAKGAPAVLDARMATVHDEEGPYVAYWVEEPFPTARDSVIVQENDVEPFGDGSDCDWEQEINARATVYEGVSVRQDASHKPQFRRAELDLVAHRAHDLGGSFYVDVDICWRGTHPRGSRRAFFHGDQSGLRTATWIDGVLNASSKRSRGWRCGAFVPWSRLEPLGDGRSLSPRPGDVWRMTFARFRTIESGTNRRRAPWELMPQGVHRKDSYKMHEPEKVSPVAFSDEIVPEAGA